MEMKEQSSCALWAMAGNTKKQQRYIADRMGISQLMDMLLLASNKLQYIGEQGLMIKLIHNTNVA